MKSGSIYPMAAVGTAIFTLLISCSPNADEEPEPPRPVFSVEVETPNPVVERSFSGLVRPAEGAPLSFEVAGRIVELRAKQGMRFKIGEVLAKLDATDYLTQLEGAQAQLTEAEQANARTQTLFATGNASQSDVEAASAKQKSAQSSFESARQKVDNCTLKMPYDGIVGNVSVDAQTVISIGQEVLTLQGEGGMEFEIGLPAAEVSKVEVGMASTITLGSLPDVNLAAKVSEVAAQPTDNTTYPVTLAIEGDIDPAVRSGMDGEAALKLPNSNGLVVAIPIECVVGRGSAEQFVWILEGEGQTRTAAKRPVVAGLLAPDGRIEIREGLRPGERIVSRGANAIEEGATVTLANPD